jgi:hypothetical protein
VEDIGKLRMERRFSSGKGHEMHIVIRLYLLEDFVDNGQREIVFGAGFVSDTVEATEIAQIRELKDELDALRGTRGG